MDKITEPQSLCLSCGICCDGTLFGKVPLKPDDDLLPLQKMNIEIQTQGKKKSFKQSCHAFQKSCCQIYAERPTNCRQFRCKLLKKFENNEVSWSDARQLIWRVQKIRENIKKEISKTLTEYVDISIPALLKNVPEHQEMIDDPVLRKKWATTMMLLAALRDCLQIHFQSATKNKIYLRIREKRYDHIQRHWHSVYCLKYQSSASNSVNQRTEICNRKGLKSECFRYEIWKAVKFLCGFFEYFKL